MLKKKNWIAIYGIIITISGTIIFLHFQKPENVAGFFPGVYACVAQNEFYQIDDSLIIRRTGIGEDSYLVTRTTSICRIRQGRKEPQDYQQQCWNARYQLSSGFLVSSNGADTMKYSRLTNSVDNGKFCYERIK